MFVLQGLVGSHRRVGETDNYRWFEGMFSALIREACCCANKAILPDLETIWETALDVLVITNIGRHLPNF